jgi:Tfp pilus assembly protein PilP
MGALCIGVGLILGLSLDLTLATTSLAAPPASAATTAAQAGIEQPSPPAPPVAGAAIETAPYDPSGRRDPFQPQAKSSGPESIGEQRTPLQQFELSQLRLVAIVWEGNQEAGARAVVEDSAGLGYIMQVGTPIGRNDGRVTRIEPGRIEIEEWPVNVFGERRRTVLVKELDAVEEAKR